MKFTLKAYRDLGRCSFGTLRESFDTDTEVIFLDGKEITISKIEDLFPFLWQHPGCYSGADGKTVSHFWSTGTHWHHDYDASIQRNNLEIEKLKKKADKATDPDKKAKYTESIKTLVAHNDGLRKLLIRLDEEMEHQKTALIQENKK